MHKLAATETIEDMSADLLTRIQILTACKRNTQVLRPKTRPPRNNASSQRIDSNRRINESNQRIETMNQRQARNGIGHFVKSDGWPSKRVYKVTLSRKLGLHT